MPNQLKIDPTRTTMLRKKFMADMTRRFKKVSKAIQTLVVDDDVFGLEGPAILQVRQAWRFRTNAQKVKAYRAWLQQQVNAGILAPVGGVSGKPWTAPYIESAYKKGGLRAYTDLRAEELANHPSLFEGGQAEFIRTAFGQPEALHKIELLYERAFDELKGITDVMGQQMSRTLAEGLAQGYGPKKIARELRKNVTKITKTRANVIARTEIIRAHAEGQLDAFEALGVEEVGVMAEWSTAGDERVCILQGISKVLTKQGAKRIKDVQKGDLVLTHKDRYKKVTKTWHRKTDERVVKIILKGAINGNERQITVTSNHPLLVRREGKILWIKAGNLKEDDLVSYFARQCPVCNKKMPMGNRFCSPECAINFGNKKRWEDPEQHKVLSRRNKKDKKWKRMQAGFQEKFRGKDFQEKFRKAVRKGQLESYRKDTTHYDNVVKANRKKAEGEDWGWRNKRRLESALKKAHMALGKNHLGKTWIEKKVEWWLKKIEVEYESQKYFYLNGKRRWVDFYLPVYNLIIEVDGENWHQDGKKDKLKDVIAKRNGFDTLRLPGREVRNNFRFIIERINNAIHNGCFVFLPIKKLKKWKLKKNQPVYNLSVESDNSYVANYMVVHNCAECGELEGVVMTIKEARGLLPRHPNCRCAWIPANKARREKGQLWGKDKDRAIERSIQAEAPKTIKRTAAEVRRRSVWAGKELKKVETAKKLIPKPKSIDDMIKKHPVELGPLECHQSIAELETIYGRQEGVLYFMWDESKGTEFINLLKKISFKSKNVEVMDLVEGIKKGWVNGHSFIKAGKHYVDPYLRSLDVAQKYIDDVDDFFASLHHKLMMRKVPKDFKPHIAPKST